jgi:hypothetical protein
MTELKEMGMLLKLLKVNEINVQKKDELKSFHKRTRNNFIDPDIAYLLAFYTYHEAGSIEFSDPEIYMAVHRPEPDTHHEAISQPDWDEFSDAALLEIRTLEKMNTWRVVLESEVRKNKKILGGTWVFKRKRDTSGKITKHKARYCVRGDQQVAGVDRTASL